MQLESEGGKKKACLNNFMLFVPIDAKEREFPQFRNQPPGISRPGFNVVDFIVSIKDTHSLDVLLELPVIHKGLLPFRHQLALELLGEFHHHSLNPLYF